MAGTTSISSSHATTINRPAKVVWRALSRYGDLSWAMEGGIEDVELIDQGIGMIRKVRMAGMAESILERLVAADEDAMSISYVIDGDGWPGLKDYVATARVAPQKQGCELRWLINAKANSGEAGDMQAGLDAMSEGIVTLFAAQFETP